MHISSYQTHALLHLCFFSMIFRYIMVVKVTDASGEAWVSVFNDQAEKIIGCSADELDVLKSQVNQIDSKPDGKFRS